MAKRVEIIETTVLIQFNGKTLKFTETEFDRRLETDKNVSLVVLDKVSFNNHYAGKTTYYCRKSQPFYIQHSERTRMMGTGIGTSVPSIYCLVADVKHLDKARKDFKDFCKNMAKDTVKDCLLHIEDLNKGMRTIQRFLDGK